MTLSKKTFVELLVLLSVISLSIALAGVQFAEQNKTSGLQENDANPNQNSTKLGLAPENPEFATQQNNRIFTQVAPSKNENGTGFIPAPVDIDHLSSESSTSEVSTPSSYDLQDTQVGNGFSSNQAAFSAATSYDLRTLGKVTTVKDQGSAGACWTFATYSSLESYLLPGENRDFSENNMKNLLSSTYSEGFDRSSSDGGNQFMSTAYLARWSGPVDESEDSYSPTSGTSPTGLTSKKHVQDVLFLPDRQGSLDNNGIKSAVQNYGAVFTSMYYDNACYSSNAYSYYYNGSSVSNHAVAIVGWDDSFDKNRFSKVPSGNGAFIIKNSWNSTWGENGYFYVSYYDSNIGTSNSIFTAESPNNYESIYQYDPLGWIESVGYSDSSTGYINPTAWGANVFTAKSDEVLKAVSFYTTGSNCNYELYIYTDPGSSPVSQLGPGLLKTGTITTAGYHTIPFDSGVQLKTGQKFSVVLKLTTPNYGYPIAVEYPLPGYGSKAKANSGESYISSDGNSWTDITTALSNTNICIKAFTASESLLPTANFSATPTSGNSPLKVQFTDASTKSPTSWKWSFGDGTSSTTKNPAHTYNTAGKYTVNLTVTNAAGSNGITKPNYIDVVNSLIYPIASFSASPTSGNAPLKVQFTDTSTNTPTSWKWSFGDGTSSTSKSPVHTYSKIGKYTVTLTVKNKVGSNTTTESNLIDVASSKVPVASFSASTTSGNAPLKVQFTDTSTNTPTSWKWSFGDGTSSTSKSPVHTYSKAGKYTVALTVKNTVGSNTVTKSNYVNVGGSLKAPISSFSASSTSGKAPLKVQFTDTSANSPTSWKWSFGDGTSSTSKNPIHTYSKTGKYTVSLTVTNAAGSNTASRSEYLTVSSK
jgi:PKD repeat protein